MCVIPADCNGTRLSGAFLSLSRTSLLYSQLSPCRCSPSLQGNTSNVSKLGPWADPSRWLYSHGRKEDAIHILSRLLDLPVDHSDVAAVVSEMEQAISVEHNQSRFTFRSVFCETTDIKNPRRLALCFALQFFQQFTGVNVIAFYGRETLCKWKRVWTMLTTSAVTIVLESSVGLSRELSSLVAGFIQIAFWLGTFPPIFLIDKLGRRKVLMLGSTVLCIVMVLFTVGVALETAASSRLALGMLIIFEIAFGMSWNSVPWLYAPEITPLNLRHVGGAVGCFSEWLWTFVGHFCCSHVTANYFTNIT